jgi:hypothetical protein
MDITLRIRSKGGAKMLTTETLAKLRVEEVRREFHQKPWRDRGSTFREKNIQIRPMRAVIKRSMQGFRCWVRDLIEGMRSVEAIPKT